MCLSAQLLGCQASSSSLPSGVALTLLPALVGSWPRRNERNAAFFLHVHTRKYASTPQLASPSPQITLHFHANIWWNWHLAIFLSHVRSQTLFILIGLRLYLVSRCPYEIRVSRYKTVDYSRTLVIGYESYPMEIGRWFLSSAIRIVRVNTVSSIHGINSSIDSWRRRDLETWQLPDCKRSSSQCVPLREN